MQFTWVDYPSQYETELEKWCDETVRHALDDDSIKKEHEWYLNEINYVLNKNYFCKVVLDGETVVALLMLSIMSKDELKKHLTETVICIDTFIINPALRQQGYATKVIAEIMQHTEKIVPFDNNIFVAQIHKENDNSKKLFKKLGFHFICTDEEIDDDWFDWIYPASVADRYLEWRDSRY